MDVKDAMSVSGLFSQEEIEAMLSEKDSRVEELLKEYHENKLNHAEIAELYGTGKVTPKRAEILHEAEKCICGQREQDYGSPEDNFATIADFWSDYKHISFTPVDVAMMMCLLKIARIRNGGGTGDSFVDLAGYAACAGEIHDKQQE